MHFHGIGRLAQTVAGNITFCTLTLYLASYRLVEGDFVRAVFLSGLDQLLVGKSWLVILCILGFANLHRKLGS